MRFEARSMLHVKLCKDCAALSVLPEIFHTIKLGAKKYIMWQLYKGRRWGRTEGMSQCLEKKILCRNRGDSNTIPRRWEFSIFECYFITCSRLFTSLSLGACSIPMWVHLWRELQNYLVPVWNPHMLTLVLFLML